MHWLLLLFLGFVGVVIGLDFPLKYPSCGYAAMYLLSIALGVSILNDHRSIYLRTFGMLSGAYLVTRLILSFTQ